MGKYRMLLRAAVKKQKGSILEIFLLVLVLALCLISALTVYISGTGSVARAMRRLGFGDFTVWVSGQPETLKEEIEAVPDVDHVLSQLVCGTDWEEMREIVLTAADADALGRVGAMLHIF